MKKRLNLYQPLVLLLILSLLFISHSLRITAASSHEIRKDGLTVLLREPIEEKTSFSFLRMIVKTGSAHEPPEKAGLTRLTNELLYYLFRTSSALEVTCLTQPEYTIFDFTISSVDFFTFCHELDTIIRLDALLLHDLCNELIQYHLNEPKNPGTIAIIRFYENLYGQNHPYLNQYYPNYHHLDIAEINNWFREIYRPANLIIATSQTLPSDFLLKPAGRNLEGQPLFKQDKMIKQGQQAKTTFTSVRDNLCTITLGFPAPQRNQKSYYASFLLTRYLEDELWQQLRQQNGLVYTIDVNYSCLTELSAPNIKIIFQTLPETFELALEIVDQVLDGLKTNGIPQSRKEDLIAREKLYLDKGKKIPGYQVRIAALNFLVDPERDNNDEDFLSLLAQVSGREIIALARQIANPPYLSIAGPSYLTKYFCHEDNTFPSSKLER